MRCSFEELTEHPDGSQTVIRCVAQAEVWPTKDVSSGMCYKHAYKTAQAALNDLKTRSFKSLCWMVGQLKWQFDEQKKAFEQIGEGGYSTALTEAIELLAELGGAPDEIRDTSDEGRNND